MPAAHKKVVLFSEYKEMSDEIKSYFKPEFERIHDRFDTFDSKFQTQFKAIDNRFDSMKIEFDIKFNALNNRIDVLDEKFKYVIGIGSSILIAVIISIIANILK